MKRKVLWIADRDLPDPRRHSYYKKVLALPLPPPSSEPIALKILHDDECALYLGDYCDCDPDVRLE